MAYKGTLPQISPDVHVDLELFVAPNINKLEEKKVLDSRVKKYTRHKVYMEHLIQWKGKPTLEAAWVVEKKFKKVGIPLDMLPSGGT